MKRKRYPPRLVGCKVCGHEWITTYRHPSCPAPRCKAARIRKERSRSKMPPPEATYQDSGSALRRATGCAMTYFLIHGKMIYMGDGVFRKFSVKSHPTIRCMAKHTFNGFLPAFEAFMSWSEPEKREVFYDTNSPLLALIAALKFLKVK